MKNDTAKNFVIQLGSLISLYLSIAFLVTLLFSLVELKFPDVTEGYWAIESASSSVRLGIAMLVVFFPTYLILTRIVNKTRRNSVSGEYTNLTRWLIYLSLLFSSLVLLGDLVSVIMAFLNGEITNRFIIKALVVLIVIGAALYYYIMDARGYWLKNESKSLTFGIGSSLFVILSLILGFAHIDTPTQVREMKLDAKQVTDLQTIQNQVINKYVLSSSSLPHNLDEAFDGLDIPQATEGRKAYSYNITDKGFELCASFAFDSQVSANLPSLPINDKTSVINADNWNYKAGDYCFKRVVKS